MECRTVDLQDLAYGFLDPDAAARTGEHLAVCACCRADFARLETEKGRLGAAAAGLAAPRDRRNVLPLAFAAALLLGLLALLIPRDPAPEPVAVPAAQDKKGPKEAPDTEEALRAEIARLQGALSSAGDDQERGRIKTVLADLQIRLDRLSGKTAMKEKDPEPKKPAVKGKPDPTDDRSMKLKMEMKGLFEKIKNTADPEERKRSEQRVREIEQELKQLDPAPKTAINLKDVEMRLQSNPDDVTALVERGTWFVDNGKGEPALKDLDRAIALKPDCAPAYLKRAIAHALLGHQPQAWQDAKKGEELDLKAGKMIDDTYRAIKKLTAAKEKRPAPADVENQIAALRDRLEELRAMEANNDLGPGDRKRAGQEAARVQVEIDRLAAEAKSRPAEPEKKIEKKK